VFPHVSRRLLEVQRNVQDSQSDVLSTFRLLSSRTVLDEVEVWTLCQNLSAISSVPEGGREQIGKV
jgi:hypothetical protein